MIKETSSSRPNLPKGKPGDDSAKNIARWYSLILIVVTLGVYWQTVNAEFTYDDRLVILEDPRIWQWDIGALWTLKGELIWTNQLRTISYMFDYALFGFSPAGYHLHNLFWHTLCVVLVFVLVKKLTQQATLAFFGAVIFAIHPINVEAVSNVTNRKELLALGFLLIAFLCYLRFLEGRTVSKWSWFLGGGVAWGLGLLSKQITIVLPLLIVVYEYLFVPSEKRFLTKNSVLLLGLIGFGTFCLSLYALFIMDITNLNTSEHLSRVLKGYRGELTYLALLATSARAFWTYIQMLVWPSGLCPNHVVDLSASFLDVRALFAWSGLLAFLIIIFRVFHSRPVLAFGMLWFFIGFLPISNWVPTSYVLADRYMYMPSVGYCIVLAVLGRAFYGWLVTAHPKRAAGIAGILAAAVILGYTGTTFAYTPYWSSQKNLLNYMLQCNPESPQAYNGLGNFYLQQGKYDKAKDYFSRAINLGFFDAYNNRGNLYYQIGEYELALKDYDQALILKPDWEKAYNNRGTVFYHMREYEAAVRDYNHAISLMPGWGEPYSNRGILYLAQERYGEAVEDFTMALERSPDRSRIFNLRGLAYEKLGDWPKAREEYSQAISADQANAEAYFNLGRVYLHNDELKAALLSYQKAKELGWKPAEEVLRVLGEKGYLEQ